jgi:hypothetical protein
VNWWRAHHGISTDAKLAAVALRAKAKRGEVLSVWISLLDFASQNDKRGCVSNLQAEDLAASLEWTEDLIARILAAMQARGIIQPDGTLTAWEKRNPSKTDETNAERQRRFREKQRPMDPGPPPEPVPEPVTPVTVQSNGVTALRNPEEKRGEEKREEHTHTQRACATDPPPSRFEEFWARWPRKTGKDSAVRSWLSYVTPQTEAAAFACLERFLRSGDVARGAIPNLGAGNNKPGWLADCARDGFECDWPQRESREEMLDRALSVSFGGKNALK